MEKHETYMQVKISIQEELQTVLQIKKKIVYRNDSAGRKI